MVSGKEGALTDEVADPYARIAQEVRAVVEDNARFLARLRDDAESLEELESAEGCEEG